MFDRPVPLKTTVGGGMATSRSGGGMATSGSGGGMVAGNKDKGKRFEKKVEVQDPSMFAAQEVGPDYL